MQYVLTNQDLHLEPLALVRSYESENKELLK